MMQIQAALAHANNAELSIETIDLAEPGQGEVVVRIVATGLCHTDLTVLAHAPLPWPAVLGHEGAGVVVKVGSGVAKVAQGDHVLMTTSSCGACKSCAEGQPSYCVQFRAMNMSGGFRRDGGCSHSQHGKPVFARFLGQSSFASHVLVGERNMVKVDKALPLDLLAPFGCGIQTGAGAVLNTLRPRAGSSLAVFGAGAVGLSALMAAKLAGCTTLIAVDKVPSRLALARELGATHVVDAGQGDAVAAVREIAGGGADYTVEATGVTAVMAQAIEALGIGGTVALVGVAGATASVSFNPMELQNKRVTIKGSIMAGDHGVPDVFIPQLIDFWKRGLFPFEKLVQHYSFDQINQAVHDAHDGSAIKPIMRLPQ
jgi:aryl-alcohol dehydrogenase